MDILPVPGQVGLGSEGLAALVADVQALVAVLGLVVLFAGGVGKLLAATWPAALVGLDALVRSFVLPQVAAVRETLSASGEFALERLLPSVHPVVRNKIRLGPKPLPATSQGATEGSRACLLGSGSLALRASQLHGRHWSTRSRAGRSRCHIGRLAGLSVPLCCATRSGSWQVGRRRHSASPGPAHSPRCG